MKRAHVEQLRLRRGLLTTENIPEAESLGEGDPGSSSLSFGGDFIPSEAIQELTFTERMEGNHIIKSSTAVVAPPTEARWDYHAETELKGPKGLIQKGICAKAEGQQDGSWKFSFQGALWEFGRTSVKNIEIFGMSNREILYWFPQLTGVVRGVDVPGLTLDEELRAFLYAVPLKGLTAKGERKFFFVNDFGVTSGEKDDVFNPILIDSNMVKTEPAWEADVPKAWGVVFARNLIEAESLALSRAQFTADLISFGLRSGISHFDTRFESIPLEWDVDIGRSRITLHPWILILDQKNTKGWIRTVPLVDRDIEIDFEDGYERISFFAERFVEATEAGDFIDQTGKRTLSDRERKLSSGIQRCLRWLRIALNEDSVGDQFIATWIALESVLNAIDYPGVFEGKRKPMKERIKQSIRALKLPKQSGYSLVVSEQMIENRLWQSQWPLRTKLALFAKAFGISLRPNDSNLVGELARMRSKVLHAGGNDPSVSWEQIKSLQYLVDRLVVAASINGYEDVEEQTRHQLQFGEIGPEGGAAPLSLNGRDVPYTLRIVRDKGGNFVEEFIIEGKIHNRRNSELTFAEKQ